VIKYSVINKKQFRKKQIHSQIITKNNQMKSRTIIFLLIIGLCSVQSFSQEQTSGGKNSSPDAGQNIKTLFGNNGSKVEHGGWGGFTLGYTKIGGEDAFISGGRGGWLIDHHFTIGLGGYGFISNINHDGPYLPTIDNYSLGGGYGGLLIEPIIAPFNPVHISFPVLIGGGGAVVIDEMSYHGYNDYYPYAAYFVLEPGIDIEVNVVKFFRIALNVSYRYTNDISLDYYSIIDMEGFSVPPNALRGFNAGLTMKFGKF